MDTKKISRATSLLAAAALTCGQVSLAADVDNASVRAGGSATGVLVYGIAPARDGEYRVPVVIAAKDNACIFYGTALPVLVGRYAVKVVTAICGDTTTQIDGIIHSLQDNLIGVPSDDGGVVQKGHPVGITILRE
jgi:hypothetical protein